MKLFGLLFSLILLLSDASQTIAQTIITGPTVSGTWTLAGSPYTVTGNCTIPTGTNLIIQPGVSVSLSANVRITNNGTIKAVGTSNARISFQCTTTTQYWNGIWSLYTPATNRFAYCDFKNASTGIILSAFGNAQAMYADILNCTFTNCLYQGIYGEAIGGYQFTCLYAYLVPTIKNCVFDRTGSGIYLHMNGSISCGGVYGYLAPTITANVFKNLTGAALFLDVGSGPSSGNPIFVNNTVVNVWLGVSGSDSSDIRIQNCIFVGCTNAVSRSGSLSGQVSYNCFSGNLTNFTGYGSAYGQIVSLNRNGTPCDALFNIFQNPSFAATNDYHLTTNSLCIDAGEGSTSNYDHCFPPSLGSAFNDQGAYGGPDACNWIGAVPVPFTVAIAKYVAVTFNPPSNGNYRLEYSSPIGSDWTALTNVNLTAPFTYYDSAAFGQRFYRAVFLP